MVLFTKLLTGTVLLTASIGILSMVLFTKLLTIVFDVNSLFPILSMVLFTKLLTKNGVNCIGKGF